MLAVVLAHGVEAPRHVNHPADPRADGELGRERAIGGVYDLVAPNCDIDDTNASELACVVGLPPGGGKESGPVEDHLLPAPLRRARQDRPLHLAEKRVVFIQAMGRHGLAAVFVGEGVANLGFRGEDRRW
jgi:hypothetical protein